MYGANHLLVICMNRFFQDINAKLDDKLINDLSGIQQSDLPVYKAYERSAYDKKIKVVDHYIGLFLSPCDM